MSAMGWCPGVLRPMEVADGLLVRVKPRMSRVTAAQLQALCEVAQDCGSGVIELTSRANLQIRAVRAAAHDALVQRLDAAGLSDPDRRIEARRQIMVTPDWTPGDTTEQLHSAIERALPDLPDLPEKLGIAIDTGAAPVLRAASADFRFERAGDALTLRADGASAGRGVTLQTAGAALAEMARWFDSTRAPGTKRMAPHARTAPLPTGWGDALPPPAGAPLRPGASAHGQIIALPEPGRITAATLSALARNSKAAAFRLMPGRMTLLEGVQGFDDPAVIVHETDTRFEGLT